MPLPVHFLNTPIGSICLFVLCVTSLFNIYAPWIEDGFFGRLLHMATAVTCAAGLLHYTSAAVPYHIATTLTMLLAIGGVRDISVRSLRFYRYRKTYAKSKH